MLSFRTAIENVFEARKSKNSRYTYRAFARQVGMSSGQLSELVTGKRGLSRKRAEDLSDRLAFNGMEKEDFLDLVEMECSRSGSIRKQAEKRFLERRKKASEKHELSLDLYQVVADWQHFAILALTGTPQFKKDPLWISEQLGVPVSAVVATIERLVRVGIVRKEKGTLKANYNCVTSTNGVPSEAIRKHHEGIFQKAIESIRKHDIGERKFMESTFALNPDDVAEYSKRASDFMNKLNEEYEKKENRTRVYSVGNFIFPLSKLTGEETK